jgi:pyridoxine kinase
MARILTISSDVMRGHVGNAATRFALQRLGHAVWALPTIMLSNHPGHRHKAGTRIDPEIGQAMLDALADNGWLGELDAVATGYLPSAGHVEMAARLIGRLRESRPGLLFQCDPVIGDDPGGLYLDAEAATAIRTLLLPLADIITPNRFELAWLSGMPVQGAAAVAPAAASLGRPVTVATSIPGGTARELANVLIDQGGAWLAAVPMVAAGLAHDANSGEVPHGTGDLLAALFLGHRLNTAMIVEAFALAVAGVDAAIKASQGRDELDLVQSQLRWSAPDPWPLQKLAV